MRARIGILHHPGRHLHKSLISGWIPVPVTGLWKTYCWILVALFAHTDIQTSLVRALETRRLVAAVFSRISQGKSRLISAHPPVTSRHTQLALLPVTLIVTDVLGHAPVALSRDVTSSNQADADGIRNVLHSPISQVTSNHTTEIAIIPPINIGPQLCLFSGTNMIGFRSLKPIKFNVKILMLNFKF